MTGVVPFMTVVPKTVAVLDGTEHAAVFGRVLLVMS